MLGVRSIVALTGDAVTVGDLPDAKGVFEINSIGLLHLIETLNGGKDLAGSELKGVPKFVPGVVVNPNARNREAELKRLRKKKDAGAIYALSQPVFDPEHAAAFFEAAVPIGVHLFVGLLPFRSAETLEGMSKVPGIKVPEALIAQARGISSDAVAELSITNAVEVASRSRPFVRGFHVVSGGTPKLAVTLCDHLATLIEG